ncbi:MAG: PAS domain S-box protein [Phycisphaerales bacterium]|nr:MAG: PAS domain S-box protein [Phycisphaerales bacterium]
MNERKKVLLFSVLIMTAAALVVGAISLFGLYRTAFEQQRERLVETVRSRARLIEAVARFDAMYSASDVPGGPEAATLSQVMRAHEQFRGFGETGEFTLAHREGDKIVFLLRHRHSDLDSPRPVPWESKLAEPMRRALSRESGTVIGLDYRGERVLAAYEWVDVVGWGMVAKIDLAEIRGIFVRAGLVASAVGVAVVLGGALLFLRVSHPLIKRLEGSEARTRAILSAAADGVITIDEQGTIESFNRAAEGIFGWTANEALGEKINVLMPAPHSEHHDEYMDYYLRTGDARCIGSRRELVGRRKDGTIFPVEVTVSEVDLPGRRLFTGIVRDITGRKRAEEALRLDEARLEALVKLNEMAEAPFRQVADFALEEAVKVTKSTMGYLGFLNEAESAVTIYTWSKIAMQECAIDEKPMVFPLAGAGLWGEIVRQRKPIVVNDYAGLKTWKRGYPEGHVHLSRFLGIPVFDEERIVSVAAVANKEDEYQGGDVRQLTLLMDGLWRIAQRQRAREALLESEANLRNAQRVAHMGSWQWEIQTGDLRWSEEIYRIFGLSPDQFGATYEAFLDSVHPDDRRLVQERVDAAVHDLKDYDIDHRIVLPGGEVRHVHELGEVTREVDGTPVRMVGTVIDITDRKRAEGAVQESRRFLQTVIDDIPELLMVIDRSYRIILANRAVRELSGGQDPVSGCLTCFQASHRRDAPCSESEHPCPVRQVIATKAPVTVTHTHFDANGQELLVEIFAAPVLDEAGEVAQIIESCRDITARVRAEEEARERQAELARVSRLGTIGEMATGLAHELNQPLAAIVNYIQACLERMRSGKGDLKELLVDMEQAAAQAERAGEIIEFIRDFVRKREPRRVAADFNALVQGATDLVRLEARRGNVQLHLELADSLPPVTADSIQIQQVVVNLARNGLEAMEETEAGAKNLTIRTSKAGGSSVECAVADTGPGLSKDAMNRLFDPFYSTKPNGLGMGLSISQSIIEGHGGRLSAETAPDGGTMFRFTLPLVDGDRVNDA